MIGVTFRKPNVKGPRYRKPWKEVIDREFCDKFRKKFPQYATVKDDLIHEIVYNHTGRIWSTVIEHRDGVCLPENLGTVFIGSCNKRKRKSIDYKKSIECGRQIENKNWETDGHMAKIFYTNNTSGHSLKDRDIWAFRPFRTFKRTVAKTYPSNWKLYRVISNFTSIANLAKKTVRQDNKNISNAFAMDFYNEFDMS